MTRRLLLGIMVQLYPSAGMYPTALQIVDSTPQNIISDTGLLPYNRVFSNSVKL